MPEQDRGSEPAARFPEGPDDPNIGSIPVTVEQAEDWDSPSQARHAAQHGQGDRHRDRPREGEHASLRMDLE